MHNFPAQSGDDRAGIEHSCNINDIVKRIRDTFGYHVVVAAEIEFYLIGAASVSMDTLWNDLRVHCAKEGIAPQKIEAERGAEQFEIALPPEHDANACAAKTIRLKALIAECAERHGITASFSAKPLPSEPGSGLHIHLHLEDAEGHNAYYKRDDEMSEALRFSLGGLLATMPRYMGIFAPHADSSERFIPGSNAPTTISWGANNRTTALRLPDSASYIKHIEHRVAGADADPEAVITAILKGIEYGLTHRCDPGAQIYGDASLAMYGLPKLVE